MKRRAIRLQPKSEPPHMKFGDLKEWPLSHEVLWTRIAERIEYLVWVLTNCVGGKTASVDHRTAKRVIDYCQRLADGKRETGRLTTELLEFIDAHNISCDWILAGDPRGMICELAKGTSSRPPRPKFTIIPGGTKSTATH